MQPLNMPITTSKITGPSQDQVNEVLGIKMTEKQRKFDTGAHRNDATGKGRYDLIPVRPIKRVAIHYERGAIGHGPRNWEKGMPFSVLVDSAKRHIDQFVDGDVSEDHLAASVWNLFAIMHFQTCMPELDDIPKYDKVSESKPEPGDVTLGSNVHVGPVGNKENM